jgi:hypothetical protein
MSSEQARARSHRRIRPHTKRSRTRDKLTNASRCHQRVRVPTRPYTHHVCTHTRTCSAPHTHPYSSTHALAYTPNILVRTNTHACNRVHACTRAHTHARPPPHAPGHPHTCVGTRSPAQSIIENDFHRPPTTLVGPATRTRQARPHVHTRAHAHTHAHTPTRARAHPLTRTHTRTYAPLSFHTFWGPTFLIDETAKLQNMHFWTLHCQS